MSHLGYPHRLQPPSIRYPTWQNEEQGPLIYLGWGERDFAKESIRMHCNPGWTYWLLTDGNVDLITPDGIVNYKAGQGFLSGPEFPYGFPGTSFKKIKLLAWIWRTPPHESIKCSLNEQLLRKFSTEQVQFLEILHEQSRNETLEKDRYINRSLGHIRGMLDIIFSRASPYAAEPHHQLIRRARQWMIHNLRTTTPSASLARYLNISPMTLHRMFKKELNTSPGSDFQEIKMAHCKVLLELEGFSIKHVAYELGYKHPQDFSRAYKNHFGHPPSECIKDR